ncbi:MAG: sensor histidine kinase [Rhodothermales bacterium]
MRDEIAFLRDYLDVQRVRFEDGLTVEEDVEAGTLDALVPNLILQPLIENAIEHGVSKVKNGGGRILLRARREQDGDGTDRLVVEISDNGPGLPGEVPGVRKGIGLANTRARLEAHYGSAVTLALKGAEESGLTAEIRFPYREATDPVLEARTAKSDA